MNNKVDISKDDQKILMRVLKEFPYAFYAYGSRVKGYARRFSDLDICYYDKIPGDILTDIKAKLEDSDIEIKVDIVAIKDLKKNFFNIIEKDLVRVL